MDSLGWAVLPHTPIEQVQAKSRAEPHDCLMLLPVEVIHTPVL